MAFFSRSCLLFLPKNLLCRNYGYVHVPKKVPPHLLGPGCVWRKCYEVHPYSEIGGVLQKYQFLTKTSVLNGLPEVYEQHVNPGENIIEDMTERAIQFLVDRFKHNVAHFRRSEITDGLLHSMIASAWQLGSKYPHLLNSHFAVNPRVETYWRRNGNNYICLPKPMNILFTSSPLQLYCDPGTTDTMMESFEYQSSEIGLFQRSFDEINVCGGCERQGPYPFAHTLFMFDRTKNNPEQTHAHALMSMFAQTSAQSVQNGFKLDQDLVYPLSLQAILTNGRRFSFACYQLNTLDFKPNSKSSKTNFLWLGPSLDLYEHISPAGDIDLNRDVLQYMCQFLLNKPIRKRPPHSGFMIDIMKKLETEERRRLKKKELSHND